MWYIYFSPQQAPGEQSLGLEGRLAGQSRVLKEMGCLLDIDGDYPGISLHRCSACKSVRATGESSHCAEHVRQQQLMSNVGWSSSSNRPFHVCGSEFLFLLCFLLVLTADVSCF